MRSGGASVTFLPANITVAAVKGESLLDCALQHGINLECECGGSCACTTCRVRVVAGNYALSLPEAPEVDRLTLEGRHDIDVRLACQALIVYGDIVVEIQEESIS